MEKVNWNLVATKKLNEMIEQAVVKGGYLSKSDFIRTAIRKQLEELGITIVGGD